MSSCDDRDCGVGAMMRGAWCVVQGVENVWDCEWGVGEADEGWECVAMGHRCVLVPMGHLWRWSGVVGAVVVQEERKMNLEK